MSSVKPTRSQLKREAILCAAKQAFQQHGVQGTSMDTLAALACVSKRTVYNHFATKEALVMELITELWRKATDQPDLIYRTDAPLQEQLGALVAAEIELLCSDDYLELVRVAFGYLFYHPETLKQEMEKLMQTETALMRWLSSATHDGKLSCHDLEFAGCQLHALIKGCCFWPQLLKLDSALDEAQKTELVDETVKMFLSRYQTH